jgi:hypothetical protein
MFIPLVVYIQRLMNASELEGQKVYLDADEYEDDFPRYITEVESDTFTRTYWITRSPDGNVGSFCDVNRLFVHEDDQNA